RRTNLWAIPARKLPGHIRGTNIISSWVQVEGLDPGKETPWVDRRWQKGHMRLIPHIPRPTIFQTPWTTMSTQK
ncbi:hypothetical protein LTR98_011699, partial [Exophiala xenobiotica]